MNDIRLSTIMTRDAFENAIVMNTALGGSTNAPIHINAIARHAGVDPTIDDWETVGYDVPLVVNGNQPANTWEKRSIGPVASAPSCMMLKVGKLNGDAMTVAGTTVAENAEALDRNVIKPHDDPMMDNAASSIDLFDSAIMKTSVVDDDFRTRFLSNPDGQCFRR